MGDQPQATDGDQRDGLVVVDATDRSRYELRRGDDLLGTATYHWDGGRIVIDHTVVDRGRRERGLGSTLARGALDDVRGRGLRLVAECPFIAAFVRDHPGYHDLLDESQDT